MSKLVSGDGRTHIASSLMRESLVDKRVVETNAGADSGPQGPPEAKAIDKVEGIERTHEQAGFR